MTRAAQTASAVEPVARLRPLSLDEVNAIAALQTRVDRKYLVEPETLVQLLESLPGRPGILEIGDQRCFGYESVYFDTPDLALYRAAAHRRRRRLKVRSRTYLDSGTCLLEVKTRDGRGRTVKSRLSYDEGDRHHLTRRGRRFIEQAGGSIGVGVGERLEPVLTTTYRRSTVVDPDRRCRLTFDLDLECRGRTGSSVSLDATIVVETKSPGSPSPADRWLWANGIRPARISKFGTGLAALDPHLPSNKWHRTLSNIWTASQPDSSRPTRTRA